MLLYAMETGISLTGKVTLVRVHTFKPPSIPYPPPPFAGCSQAEALNFLTQRQNRDGI